MCLKTICVKCDVKILTVTDTHEVVRSCVFVNIGTKSQCKYNVREEDGLTEWLCICNKKECNANFHTCGCRSTAKPLSTDIINCLFIQFVLVEFNILTRIF